MCAAQLVRFTQNRCHTAHAISRSRVRQHPIYHDETTLDLPISSQISLVHDVIASHRRHRLVVGTSDIWFSQKVFENSKHEAFPDVVALREMTWWNTIGLRLALLIFSAHKRATLLNEIQKIRVLYRSATKNPGPSKLNLNFTRGIVWICEFCNHYRLMPENLVVGHQDP